MVNGEVGVGGSTTASWVKAKTFSLCVDGAMVLSEPVYLPDPYVPGKHYVEAPLDQMPDVARHYLANEDARRAIADAGHTFMTRELTLKKCFAAMLTLAAERLSET